jgi:nucleoside-diphosphate-sugar epimerase
MWTVVHRDDLADAYVRALTLAPAGMVLNIVSEPAVSFRAVAQAIAAGCGLDRPIEVWQESAARQVLGPLVDALLLNQQISGARARDILKWTRQAPSILEELEYGSYGLLASTGCTTRSGLYERRPFVKMSNTTPATSGKRRAAPRP